MSKTDWHHEALWEAIDEVAAHADWSASRLAIVSGLNNTTFNKSKRISRHGQRRWPTMEVIAKVLLASGMTYSEFGALIDKKMGSAATKE